MSAFFMLMARPRPAPPPPTPRTQQRRGGGLTLRWRSAAQAHNDEDIEGQVREDGREEKGTSLGRGCDGGSVRQRRGGVR